MRRGSKPIVGGGIGGLAAAVALRKVGIDAAVFEKAPQIAEIGAGMSLWSHWLIALRRLGLEARAVATGAIMHYATTVLPQGKTLPGLDLSRARRQSWSLNDLHSPRRPATFAAGGGFGGRCERRNSRVHRLYGRWVWLRRVLRRRLVERGEVLIGADGIHSAIRLGLFGKEELRFSQGARLARHCSRDRPAPSAAARARVVGSGAHAGFFYCGDADIYWFLTRNAAPGSQAEESGNKGRSWR